MSITMRPPAILSKVLVAVFAAMILAAKLPSASAHEIRPAIAEFSEEDRSSAGIAYKIALTVNLEALIARIGPEHDDTSQSDQADMYDRLRRLAPDGLTAEFDAFADEFLSGITLVAGGTRQVPSVRTVIVPDIGDLDLARISRIELEGTMPPDTGSFTWSWSKVFGAIAVRVRGSPSDTESPVVFATFVQPGEISTSIPLGSSEEQDAWDVVAQFLVVGFVHIVPLGLDHILFVIGLFLLTTRLSALVWQVSSFTVAHTVTLALGMLGLVRVSPDIVEPLIAASIVYVGVENVLTARMQRWRLLLVFGFGLLHGMGFAGVLDEIGLQPTHFAAGLIAFNIGVELGQLAVIACCFAAVGYWFSSKPWYRQRITIPASILISAVGLWWFVERSLL